MYFGFLASKALHCTLCHAEHFSFLQFQPWMLIILTLLASCCCRFPTIWGQHIEFSMSIGLQASWAGKAKKYCSFYFFSHHTRQPQKVVIGGVWGGRHGKSTWGNKDGARKSTSPKVSGPFAASSKKEFTIHHFEYLLTHGGGGLQGGGVCINHSLACSLCIGGTLNIKLLPC